MLLKASERVKANSQPIKSRTDKGNFRGTHSSCGLALISVLTVLICCLHLSRCSKVADPMISVTQGHRASSNDRVTDEATTVTRAPSQDAAKAMVTPVATDQEICGKASRSLSIPRIVGGKNANFHEFPWQAYLQIAPPPDADKNAVFICGGSIVSHRHIVTAAHCVDGSEVSGVTALIGALNIDKPNAQAEKAYDLSISKISFHPKHKSSQSLHRYDVAILELEKPVKYAGNILPVCLPERDLELNNRTGVVIGWGMVSRNARDNPSTLKKVELPVVTDGECKSSHKRLKGNTSVDLREDQFCAGYPKGGKDACVGDSGGPFLLNVEGRWTLAGITSGGVGCALPGLPGVYHKVTSSVDWIRKVIAN